MGLDQGMEGWGGVMYVWVVSADSRCRWQVQVSVYRGWRIPAHLRCTQMLDVMKYIEASIFLNPTLVRVQVFAISTYEVG